jgi:putative transcriptional regulator
MGIARIGILGLILGVAALASSAVGAQAPAKGMLLVAARGIGDPRFRNSVVLLLEHGRSGSMGVIVNRASGVAPERVLPRIEGLKDRDDELFFGGPVLPDVVIILARSEQAPPESARVFADVYYSASSVALEQLLAGDRSAKRLRLFFGHAGWGPGQLDLELARGDWHVVPADIDLVFDSDPATLWRRLIKRVAPKGLQARYATPVEPLRPCAAQFRLLDAIS